MTRLQRRAVADRVDELVAGHTKWAERRRIQRAFPSGPYVLMHTLSRCFCSRSAIRCGYPASSIRERIYVDYENGRSDCRSIPPAQTLRARSAGW